MSRTVSLSTLRSDVRAKGDFGGATVRHTDAQLTRLINQSIQSFRERISDEGSQHYLRSSTGSLGVGPTDPYPFYQLDLSALSPSLVRTYGIDVTIDNEVVSLEHVPFEQRSKYGSRQSGQPLAWSHFRTDQVAILPPSSSAYAYVVWYLPLLADLSADGDTFNGVAGWEEFIVWDVVCQLIARDQFPQAYQIAEQRRQEVWQNVIRGATKVTQAGGAHTGRDSFGAKLPHFLGGRRPTVAAAGGPVTPTQDSVTVGHLAHFAGPAVIGVPSGTTDPIHWQVASLTSYLTQFNTLRQGVVPLSDGLDTSFLAADGAWRTPAGGGVGNSAGPSGAVQFQAGTGFAGASGFRIHGNSPSLVARLEGSLRVTGGQVEVGSGTVRIQASGIDLGNGSIVNVATLVAQDISARGLLVSSGIPNSQLSPMASGTVKAQLGADGLPTDVPVATLLSLVPTFTSTFPGVVPGSGGGTTNYLRADGTWGEPPGTATIGGSHSLSSIPGGSIQYHTASGTFGGSLRGNLRIVESSAGAGVGIAWGSSTPSAAALGWSNATTTKGRTASGLGQAIFDWRTAGFAGNGLSGAAVFYGNSDSAPTGDIQAHVFRTQPSGSYHWQLGPSGLAHMSLQETGLDARQFHVAAKSLTVTEGIANTELASMASGTVKGQLGPAGTPNDVAVATLHAFAPTFTATNPGTVPESGGGTDNFLRADGTWGVPPGGSATTSQGPAGAIQYSDGAGGFFAASGITIAGSGGVAGENGGAALIFGKPSGAGNGLGTIRSNGIFSVYGTTQSGTAQRLIEYSPTGDAAFGGTGTVLKFGSVTAQRLQHLQSTVGTGGSFSWFVGGTGTQAQLTQTGMDLLPFHLAAKGLTVTEGVTNANLATMSTGTIKGSLGGGTPADVPFATFMAFAPTFTAARAGVVPPSDGAATSFLAGDGAWRAPSGAHQFPPVAGATNAQLAVMSTGTVKANLSGNATPSDVPIATLLAFAPTFTSTRMGVVPASGGGTTNFLRADGTWGAPPGTAAAPGAAIGAIQFNNGAGGFGGASGVNIVASGQALGFGVPSFLPSSGDIRVASGGLSLVHGPGAETLQFLPTGIHAPDFHIRAKSLDVLHINGLPTDANQLSRGINIGSPGGTGVPSGLRLYAPGAVSTGANRFIIPSGYSTVSNNITLSPTGAKGGAAIRVERLDPAGALNFVTPTGTILYSMPSGVKHVADFVFTKPSGPNFEHGGQGDLF